MKSLVHSPPFIEKSRIRTLGLYVANALYWRIEVEEFYSSLLLLIRCLPASLAEGGSFEMDPLSLTASIITVVGAASTVSRGLKKILSARNLPHIVLQLNNEVTDLQVVIQDVEDLLCRRAQVNREDRKPLQKQASLVRALEHANQTLLALQSLIACKLTTVDSRDGRIKFKRKSWLLVESRVKSLKDEIRTDRLRLSAAQSLLAS